MDDMMYVKNYNNLVILILAYYLCSNCNFENSDFEVEFADVLGEILNNNSKNINKNDKIDRQHENKKKIRQEIVEISNLILSLESFAETQTTIGFLFRSLKFSLFEKFCFLLSLFYICDERVRIVVSCLDNISDFGISLDLLLKIFNVLKSKIDLCLVKENDGLKSQLNSNKEIYENKLETSNEMDNDTGVKNSKKFDKFEGFQEFSDLGLNVLGLNRSLNCDRPWYQKIVLVSQQAQNFVFGVNYINRYFGNIIDDFDKNIYDNKKTDNDINEIDIREIELLNQLDVYIENLQVQKIDSKLNILVLSGGKGSGKKMQIKVLEHKFGFNTTFVDFDFLSLKKQEEILEVLSEIVLDAILFQKLICFCNFKSKQTEVMQQVILYLHRYFSFVVFLTENRFSDFDFADFDDEKFLIANIQMPDLTEKERCFFWKRFLFDSGISDEEIEKVARGFLLTIGKIRSVSQKYFLGKTENLEENIKLLKKLAAEASGYDFGNLATRVKHNFDWNDLVLDINCKSKLLSICDRVKLKDKVYEEMNFKSKFPYGDGISVLFYGPPGTGKTMAANVIANQIGCELYKIDLSQLVDKYVGETEKNLKNLFDMATKTNVVLFFDEADSIFSKRTDVTNSNDKYANIETSYLLQRIEEYKGICILATNFLSSFDDAFKRRMKFIVNFNLPGVDERLLLWKKAFPPQVEISDDVDFFRLSEKFELTGSSIKSIALSAAFYSVKDKEITNKNVVGIKHVKMALRDELEKNGKIFSELDLGLY